MHDPLLFLALGQSVSLPPLSSIPLQVQNTISKKEVEVTVAWRVLAQCANSTKKPDVLQLLRGLVLAGEC